MFEKYNKSVEQITVEVGQKESAPIPICGELTDNLIYINEAFGDSQDLSIRRSDISGREIAFIYLDGMCDGVKISQSILKPVMLIESIPRKSENLFEYIRDYISVGAEQAECHSMNELADRLMSGYAVMLINGEQRALALGVQGFAKRAVGNPMSEVQEKGSQEGFVDNFKDNMALVRRRLRTTNLRLENMEVGETSKTRIIICYLKNRVPSELVNDVKVRLNKAVLDTVLGSGELVPFLDAKGLSLFSGVGSTERPDTFCAKLAEGKIGIIIDGTPYALYVPHMFIEYFHSLDDYQVRPYFAVFLRGLKILGFLLGTLLPGVYVAVGMFHQELFPADLLFDIALSESQTPLPVMLEAIVIHIIYEIVREAGIRMPQVAGHMVTIVGALVIGEAAVTAGLIGAPMLIIVALTAICSAIVSSIHQATAILRFSFIIIGGTLGLYGMVLGVAVVFVNICSINPYGVVYTSPVTPLKVGAARDTLLRLSWKTLGKRQLEVGRFKNADE